MDSTGAENRPGYFYLFSIDNCIEPFVTNLFPVFIPNRFNLIHKSLLIFDFIYFNTEFSKFFQPINM